MNTQKKEIQKKKEKPKGERTSVETEKQVPVLSRCPC
jgi:hypothetical protein